MMPREHIGSGSSWRYRRKRELCECVTHARDGGVLPVTGFPRYGGMAIEERAKTSLGHGANTSISYNTCIRSTDVVSGLYLRSVHSGRNAFEVEVVVHGVIMEVAVHISQSCKLRRCSGSSVEVLDAIHANGACSGIGLDEGVLGQRSGTRRSLVMFVVHGS